MAALITRHFRIHNAIQFFESFSEASPTRYYYFIGKNYPYANAVPIAGQVKLSSSSNTVVGTGTVFNADLTVGDVVRVTGTNYNLRVHAITGAQTFISTVRPSTTVAVAANCYIRKSFSEMNPPIPIDNYQEIYYDIWRNMMSAKRIQPSDVSHVIPRYDWANNTVYVQYSDINPNLENEPFYVFTNENNVYKCIDNNRGSPSTVRPTGVVTNDIISTMDGYRWKYMYTVSSGKILKFVTSDFIPVQTLLTDDSSDQWDVQSSAANGAIQKIVVVANGSGYISVSNTFASVNTNGTRVNLSVSSSGVDDIYNGSGMFISSGVGVGQIRKIVKYFGANNLAIVNSAFTTVPTTSSNYIISPLVTIRGDSGKTTTSRATAYVSNTFGGQIRNVTIISQGRSYSTANVVISANSSHGYGAVATPVISPLKGHGSDAVDELYGERVMMNVRVFGSESNTFATNNDFRMIGVLRDPMLANGSPATASVIDQTTRVSVTEVSGDFYADEIITGDVSRAQARLVYFANTNASRTRGVLKLVRVTTNGVGSTFVVGETVRGSSSTRTANVQIVTVPAMQPFSGLIIYTENRIPVTRSNDQTEDIKLTIKF
jgi:hypothetical protein